ncbi:Glycoside hydrolase superfamily [Penicillium chermesinum]|uniref:1,3-beta-glucanosyltransferase n=1 Tax=Penicillium chermesinum TaxID=63820 RepID=A0A9W9P910_9EURO|nr:Glycoside hydrolase superfamily [Penicillium chermesinum]KAJ5240059.1 Glycoside hydrolase superfamily [Penicillium chermesinum]KAJ6166935.1 Glycoside hydrolase superfamily [Penicillium chermesinum]
MFSSAVLAPLLLAGLQAAAVSAVPHIEAVGSKFFFENGTQYYIKGIAYQLTPDDPLIDEAQCKRDIVRMSELGANAIRVYHVDPTANHKACMSAFADAGIYLFVDLDTFTTQIEQTNPHWNQTQFDRFKEVLDEFQQFDNTAGVFVGNEVLTTAEGSHAAPFVLAAARDIKAYRDQKGYREIPVGYSAADIPALRPMLQNYLACSDKAADRLDFYSLNAYEWCGDSSYTTSGYDQLQKNATGYNIPIFFSETGCNQPTPRSFDDQAAIFGTEMEDTWSGSIIYEWIEETNDYGLISYGPSVAGPATNTIVEEGYTRQGTPSPVQPDFNNLKSQWAKASPTGIALSEYRKSTASIKAVECPASTSGGWAVDPKAPLPTIGEAYNGQTATETGSSGSSGSSGSQTATRSSATTTENGASPMIGVTNPATERLLAASLALSSIFGVIALWL